MPLIYHITTRAAWEKAQELGFYEAGSLKEEGYIHCSQENQISGVLERYYAGQTDLLKLSIDTDTLTSPYIYDWSPSTADTFPHVYGPINIAAVVAVDAIN